MQEDRDRFVYYFISISSILFALCCDVNFTFDVLKLTDSIITYGEATIRHALIFIYKFVLLGFL